MVRVDYIIPVSNIGGEDFEDRVINLNFVLKTFLSIQTNIDLSVYIVEQVVDHNLTTFYSLLNIPDNLKVSYKSVSYPIFCKPWLYNIGVKMSNSENIILGDMDAWSDRDYFNELIRYADYNNLYWCFGWDRTSLLTKDRKEKLIYQNILDKDVDGNILPQDKITISSEKLKIRDENNITKNPGNYDDDGYIVPKENRCEGYIVLFKRDFFMNMLIGTNELFRELGANDNEIVLRAKKMSSTYAAYPITIVHLWHRLSKMKYVASWELNQRLFKFTRIDDNYLHIHNFLRSVSIGNEKSPLDINFINNFL